MDFQRFQFNDIGGGTLRPLKFVANRYRFRAYPEGQKGGLILLFMHGVGMNKEAWEPLLEDLAAADRKSGRRPTIKEAWAYDLPSVGESGLLNEEYLVKDERHANLEEWSHAGLRLLTSGHVKDLENHQLVFIGHSGGTLTSTWLSTLLSDLPHPINVKGYILIEPPSELFYSQPFTKLKTFRLMEAAKKCRYEWNTEEEAREWFSEKLPWKTWDGRCLEAFIKHGLRPLPSLWSPSARGVALTATRSQDVFAYGDVEEVNIAARMFPSLRKRGVPIHVLVSEQSFVSPDEKECKHLHESGLPVTILPPEGGHQVVSEMPTELANCILGLLDRLLEAQNERIVISGPEKRGRLLEARL